MNADQFRKSRQAEWQALSNLVTRSQKGLRQLAPEDVTRLGRLYRAATSDLALAQRDFPRHPVTAYLNQLVGQAHAVIYQSEPLALSRLRRFITTGFPRAYRDALPFILAAALLFLLPALAAGLSAALEPTSARWLLPASAQSLLQTIAKGELWTDIPIHERPYASAFIMTNNIRVSFLAFGGGMLAGTLTIWTMIFNGLILGGLTGATLHYGIGFELWTFVIGHGMIELTVIIISGGAGLMLGWAMLRPGWLRRRDALMVAGRCAVRLLAGCVPLLVIAGLIEGFISPAENLPWGVKWAVGLGTGLALHLYLLRAGRQQPHSNVRPLSSR